MLSTTRIIFSKHAAERYRTRVKPNATKKDMKQSVRAGKKGFKKKLQEKLDAWSLTNYGQKWQKRKKRFYLANYTEKVVFVLASEKAGEWIVVTCFTFPEEKANES
mgnify:CR=1 FL=1